MFRIFPVNTNIPFLNLRAPAIALSLLLCAGAVFFLATRGLNYGVDFAGGVQMVLNFDEDSGVDAERIRGELADLGIPSASVQNFGTDFDVRPTEFIIHFPADILDGEMFAERLESVFADLKDSPDERLVTEFRMSGFERAYFRMDRTFETDEVAARVEEADFGLIQLVRVAPFGSRVMNEYELSFTSVATEIVNHFNTVLGGDDDRRLVQADKVEFVGARVGQDLKMAALLSVLVTILLVFIYIFLRFDLVYAPGVVVALGHDVLITTGLFALTGFEFDLTVVAALLTVAGYSINDTIVVYDRIREARSDYKGKSLLNILNIALNQTMNRTVITSGTTLMATVVLWVVGGPVIHSFAFALSVGILVGTYSSVFIAAPLVYWMSFWLKGREEAQKAKKKAVA